MQPENALNSWSQWNGDLRSRPIMIRPLSGGRSNHSFLLDSDGNKMVLRLNGTDSTLPGANRNGEIDIWQAASNKGIAPPLLYVDENAGYLVSRYIKNKLPPQPQLDKTIIDQAFSLLKRCHQLDVTAPSINYASHIKQYWNIIEAKNHPGNPALNAQREPMLLMLKTLINNTPQTALCHHDPVPANFVGSPEKLYLIDWEYAAIGLPIMDYAALATEWGVEDSLVLTQTGFEPELLDMAKSLYRYLCELWDLS